MDKSICVAVQGTVSIDVEEYRELVTAQAYLDVIVAVSASDKFYGADNIVSVISDLVNPVITAKQPSSGDEDGETDA